MPPPLPTNLGNRASNENDRVLQKRHLQDLLQNIDPLGQLDDEVEEVCFIFVFCTLNVTLYHFTNRVLRRALSTIYCLCCCRESNFLANICKTLIIYLFQVLLQIGDDFLEDVISASAQIAAHRKSKQLEAKDVLLYLDRHHDLWLPGYSKEEFKPPKKDICTEQHKQVGIISLPYICYRNIIEIWMLLK